METERASRVMFHVAAIQQIDLLPALTSGYFRYMFIKTARCTNKQCGCFFVSSTSVFLAAFLFVTVKKGHIATFKRTVAYYVLRTGEQ